jgi:hypothetical protein
MPLRMSSHARDRMRDRSIFEADIESALQHKISTQPGEPGTIVVRGYAPNGHILKVFVRASDHEYVISAMWPGR